MKKYVLSLVTLVFTLALTACFGSKQMDVNELKKQTGTMMVLERRYNGIERDEEDTLERTVYKVDYNGTVDMEKIYKYSGSFTGSTELSDNDYMLMYTNALKIINDKNHKLEEYQVGLIGEIPSWKITFYNADYPNGTVIANGVYAGGNDFFDTITGVAEYHQKGVAFTNAQGEDEPFYD